jgi:hypothetical protein
LLTSFLWGAGVGITRQEPAPGPCWFLLPFIPLQPIDSYKFIILGNTDLLAIVMQPEFKRCH